MADQDDLQLQNYQDDLTTKDSMTDPVMNEEGDDPTKELGVPPAELKRELDGLDIERDNGGEPSEDARERVEDLDQDDGDDTKY